MRQDPLPVHQAEAPLPALPFEQIETLLRAEAEEHGLDLHSGHGRSTWCRVEGGEFGVRRAAQGCVLYARAHSRDWLFALQEAITAHLAGIAPDHAAALQWIGGEDAGQYPPNFSLARVMDVSPVGSRFLRLRLAGTGLDRLARDMIHFRLVLPPPGDPDPQWPVIGPRGQTVWPEGAQALHRPAYTVRRIDPQAGWLDTDIFIHPGGRVCDWARRAEAGTLVGLNGPGGGGVPQGNRLLIGGDETAYPALARTLAESPANVRGQCWLFGDSPDYDWPDHPGIPRIHAPRAEADLAADLIRQGCAADRIWIATEKSRLQHLRSALFDQLGIAKSAAHLAAYWAAGE